MDRIRWMPLAAALVGVLMGSLVSAGEARTARAPGGRIVFEVLSGETTGLKAVIGKWKAGQLELQGGKFQSHGWWLWGLRAFDYDSDGDIDLLAQQHGKPQTIIIRNELKETGKLTFVNANSELGLPPTGGIAGCFAPLVWDFDGDGWLDLAYCDAQRNTCFFNQVGKGFEPMGYAFGQLAGIRHIGDVNGDGYVDVCHDQARYLFDPKTRKFRVDRTLNPRHADPPPEVKKLIDEMKAAKKRFVPRYLRFFENVELDGDPAPDVACGYFGSYGGPRFGRYFIGDVKGEIGDLTEELGLPGDGTPILIEDLTGDGLDEVLIVGGGYYRNTGKHQFELRPGPLTNFLKRVGSYCHKAGTADFDADGDPDLVVWNRRGHTVMAFENSGGDFSQVLKTGSWVDPVGICDIDGDGLLDIVVGGPGETVTIYLNRTKNAGNSVWIRPRMPRPNPCAVGAVIEVFRPGRRGDWRGTLIARAEADPTGKAVHIGLGKETKFDLDVSFPAGVKTRETLHLTGVAGKRYVISPRGGLEEEK